MVIDDRIANKNLGTKLKKEGKYDDAKPYLIAADGLKIVANSGLFGKFGFDGWLLDKQCVYQVTVNGQLMLIMLAEAFESNNIRPVSANTDGITSLVHLDNLNTYQDICTDWESKMKMTLEFANYAKYARTSVNDYIAVYDKWLISKDDVHDVKRKGDFVTDIAVNKGYSHPIVPIAIDKYFLHNIPVRQTIENHNNIYDFCMSVKTGDSYDKEFIQVINGEIVTNQLQKNVRYYVSKSGGGLTKKHKYTGQVSTMAKSTNIIPFNNYYEVDSFKDYDIDYDYYIRKAWEIINKCNGNIVKGTKGFSKTGRKKVKDCSNGLFNF